MARIDREDLDSWPVVIFAALVDSSTPQVLPGHPELASQMLFCQRIATPLQSGHHSSQSLTNHDQSLTNQVQRATNQSHSHKFHDQPDLTRRTIAHESRSIAYESELACHESENFAHESRSVADESQSVGDESRSVAHETRPIAHESRSVWRLRRAESEVVCLGARSAAPSAGIDSLLIPWRLTAAPLRSPCLRIWTEHPPKKQFRIGPVT
jgi:hypothetical protein